MQKREENKRKRWGKLSRGVMFHKTMLQHKKTVVVIATIRECLFEPGFLRVKNSDAPTQIMSSYQEIIQERSIRLKA